MNTLLTFKFTIDDDAQFEECNGESRPLTEAEYVENGYRQCSIHPRQSCACDGLGYVEVPYAEYLQYYGNPDRHVYVFLDVYYPDGGSDGLGNIDLMDDSDEWLALIHQFGRSIIGRKISAAQAVRLPGYLRDVCLGFLDPVEQMIALHEVPA